MTDAPETKPTGNAVSNQLREWAGDAKALGQFIDKWDFLDVIPGVGEFLAEVPAAAAQIGSTVLNVTAALVDRDGKLAGKEAVSGAARTGYRMIPWIGHANFIFGTKIEDYLVGKVEGLYDKVSGRAPEVAQNADGKLKDMTAQVRSQEEAAAREGRNGGLAFA